MKGLVHLLIALTCLVIAPAGARTIGRAANATTARPTESSRNCNAGEIVVEGHIRYNCTNDGLKALCKTLDARLRSGDSGSFSACIGTSKTAFADIQINQTMAIDDMWFSCDGMNGRVVYKEERQSVCLIGDNTIPKGDTTVIGTLVFLCSPNGTEIVGCLFPKGEDSTVQLKVGESVEIDGVRRFCSGFLGPSRSKTAEQTEGSLSTTVAVPEPTSTLVSSTVNGSSADASIDMNTTATGATTDIESGTTTITGTPSLSTPISPLESTSTSPSTIAITNSGSANSSTIATTTSTSSSTASANSISANSSTTANTSSNTKAITTSTSTDLEASNTTSSSTSSNATTIATTPDLEAGNTTLSNISTTVTDIGTSISTPATTAADFANTSSIVPSTASRTPETTSTWSTAPSVSTPQPSEGSCVVDGVQHANEETWTERIFRHICKNGAVKVSACIIDEDLEIPVGESFAKSGLLHHCVDEGDRVAYKTDICGIGDIICNVSTATAAADITDATTSTSAPTIETTQPINVLVLPIASQGTSADHPINAMSTCVTADHTFRAGETWISNNFKKLCHTDGSISIEACVTEAKQEVAIGEILFMDGLQHTCAARPNGGASYSFKSCGGPTLCELEGTRTRLDLHASSPRPRGL